MDKIKWNGAPTTFDEYHKSVEGHMLQTGLGYMLKKDFQQQYTLQWDKYLTSLEFCEANFVSASQALYDKVYLYGALLSSLSTASKSNRYLSTHDQDKDGITVWIEWVKAYSNKGSTRIRIDELETNMHIRYAGADPAGVSLFIDEFVTMCIELEGLYVDTVSSGITVSNICDSQKKCILCNNLCEVPIIYSLVQQHCLNDSISFQDPMNQICQAAIQSDYDLGGHP